MHIKSLVIGILIGAAAATAVLLTFGDTLLGRVGGATQEVGKTVREVGRSIEKTSDKLK